MNTQLFNRIMCFTLIYVAMASILASCGGHDEGQVEKQPKMVKVFHVGSSSQHRDNVFTGKVEASQEAMLSFQVSGEVIEKAVEKGQKVEEGQLLARLDPKEFQLELDEARATRNQRKVALGRTEKLLEKGFATPAKYDRQKADLEVAEAQYEKALKDLKDSEIKAPFSGRISDIFIEEHQQIKANAPVLSIHNTDQIDIALDVSENVIIRLREGGPKPRTEVRFDAAPEQSYFATYHKHTDTADPQTQTFRVYLTMKAPEELNIRPGMTATVTATGLGLEDQGSEGFFVPIDAVIANESGESYVWVVDEDSQKVAKQMVKIGLPRGDEVLVTEGLKGNEIVVSAGASLLQEGQAVNPVDGVFGR